MCDDSFTLPQNWMVDDFFFLFVSDFSTSLHLDYQICWKISIKAQSIASVLKNGLEIGQTKMAGKSHTYTHHDWIDMCCSMWICNRNYCKSRMRYWWVLYSRKTEQNFQMELVYIINWNSLKEYYVIGCCGNDESDRAQCATCHSGILTESGLVREQVRLTTLFQHERE